MADERVTAVATFPAVRVSTGPNPPPTWREVRETWMDTGTMEAYQALRDFGAEKMTPADFALADQPWYPPPEPPAELPPADRHRNRVAATVQVAALLICIQVILFVLITRGML